MDAMVDVRDAADRLGRQSSIEADEHLCFAEAEPLLRTGVVVDRHVVEARLSSVDGPIGERVTVDAALTATLALLEGPDLEVGAHMEELVQTRASRMTDMRHPRWRTDRRTACTAIRVGYVLGWAVLGGAPPSPVSGRPRWWLLVAGADQVHELGCVADHPVLGATVDRINQDLFRNDPLGRRGMLDGVTLALTEAVVADGGVRPGSRA